MISFASQHWAFQFLVVLFLVGGLATLGVGAGLIMGSAGTLRFLIFMNRWVYARRASGPIADFGDTGRSVQNRRRWLAVLFIAGAAYAIWGLGTWFAPGAVSHALGLDMSPSSVARWLIASARWTLIVGSLAAIVIGISFGFFPEALAALEARGGNGNFFRRLAQGANTMNLPLDRWVAASPLAAGWIITVAGLILVGDYAFVLFGGR